MLTWLISEPLPPSVFELLADPNVVGQRYPRQAKRSWRHSRRMWPFSLRDTASASFYRMYEFLVVDRGIALREELEYFCVGHPEWTVRDLPQPMDAARDDESQNLTRYAVLAALVHIICDVFNRRIELGLPRDAPAIIEDWEELARRPKVYEEVPRWAREAGPLPEALRIPNAKGQFVEAGSAAACVRAKQMNILMHEPDVHFV